MLWNATFFCGSCAVLRREALDEVGGVATDTVTEDAHTARCACKYWDGTRPTSIFRSRLVWQRRHWLGTLVNEFVGHAE